MPNKCDFLSKFNADFAISPSPSIADNGLVATIIDVIQTSDDVPDEMFMRSLLAWQTKQLPRHFISEDGTRTPDIISSKWSPGFYRIDGCLPELKEKLSGSDVLDPFSGSGSLIHSLIALDITNSITLSDKCNYGGIPISRSNDQTPLYYSPEDNWIEYLKLFSSYTDFVKRPVAPDKIPVMANDVNLGLPYDSNSFDWIYTDPPYGRNLKCEGVKDFLSFLPELMRVSRNGALMLLPETWIPIINCASNYRAEDRTGTLEHRGTTFRTTLAHVYNWSELSLILARIFKPNFYFRFPARALSSGISGLSVQMR